MQINNNIKESYCSFEVSKLLRGKGFAADVFFYYNQNGAFLSKFIEIDETMVSIGSYDVKEFPLYAVDCPAPTHALAIEWIRQNFKVEISIEPVVSQINLQEGYNYYTWCRRSGAEHWSTPENTPVGEFGFDSPQKATEAALLYALQYLIK